MTSALEPVQRVALELRLAARLAAATSLMVRMQAHPMRCVLVARRQPVSTQGQEKHELATPRSIPARLALTHATQTAELMGTLHAV